MVRTDDRWIEPLPLLPWLSAAGLLAGGFAGWAAGSAAPSAFTLCGWWLVVRCAVSEPLRERVRRSVHPGAMGCLGTIGFLAAGGAAVGLSIAWMGWEAFKKLFSEVSLATVSSIAAFLLTAAAGAVLALGLAATVATLFRMLPRRAAARADGDAAAAAPRLSGSDLVDELVPFGWFVLAASGPSLAGWVSGWNGLAESPEAWWANPRAIAMGLVGATVPWLGWFQSLHARRPFFPPRLLLALLAGAAHHHAVFALFDRLVGAAAASQITRPVGFWLVLVLAGLLASAGCLAFSSPISWRTRLTNGWAVLCLRTYFGLDRRGACFLRLRHLGHRLRPLAAGARRVGGVAGVVLGAVPAWIWPDDDGGVSRQEAYLRFQYERGFVAFRRGARDLRAAAVHDRPDRGELARRVQVAAARLADVMLALESYWRCPHCTHCDLLPTASRLAWQQDADCLLLDGAAAGLDTRTGSLAELRRHVLDNYRMPDTVASTEHPLGLPMWIVRWRGEALQAAHAGEVASAQRDPWRLRWRDAIVREIEGATAAGAPGGLLEPPAGASGSFLGTHSDSHTGHGAGWERFVVHTLLAQYRADEDWEGLIDTCIRLRDETAYALHADDYLNLGEAWWRHAAELHGDFRTWACEQAVSCFYQAASPAHLDVAAPPFQETNHEPTHSDGDRTASVVAAG